MRTHDLGEIEVETQYIWGFLGAWWTVVVLAGIRTCVREE